MNFPVFDFHCDTALMLLGDDLTGRKNHIADCGYKYLDLADIS